MTEAAALEAGEGPELEPSNDLSIPAGITGLAASFLLALWAAYSLPESVLQAGSAAGLAIVITAISVRGLAAQSDGDEHIQRVVEPGWLQRRIPLDVLLFIGVMLVAAVPRLIALGDIPPGLHGDEAIAGIEARRILDGGSIGPYSLEARGVPAGTFYWTAAVLAAGGEDIFTVRLAFALIGIATIGALYACVRIAFNRQLAVMSSLLLAVSAWHLHYSRIAFIPIGLPLFIVLTIGCSVMAVQRRSMAWSVAAGAALGAGVYTYQAYPAFLAAFGVICILLAAISGRLHLRQYSGHFGLMLVAAVVVAIPMLRFIKSNPDVFMSRYREYSVFATTRFKEADGLGEKADFLLDRQVAFLAEILAKPRLDFVDGAGLFRLVDFLSVALVIVGIGIAVARVRSPVYFGLLTLTGLMLLSPVVAVEGEYRRALGVTPLLAVLGALPLGLVLSEAQRFRPLIQGAAAGSVCLVLVIVGGLNFIPYFNSYDDHPDIERLYAAPFVAGLREVSRLGDDVHVYLLSERIPYNHPNRVFLIPANSGEDRSSQFGRDGFSLEADRSRDVFYLFLDRYVPHVTTVERMYPGRKRVTGPTRDGTPLYEGYYVARR